MNLENLRIVLVGTTHPGNIGASARAMKTMGIENLVLVNPMNFPHADATARATGADDVLVRARVADTLADAIDDCRLVIGASARLRRISVPELDPRACAARVAEVTLEAQVALVFGREQSGLSNEEMDRCHFLVRIPTNPNYRSLNLAAAVQVLAYEMRTAREHASVIETPGPKVPLLAPVAEMERFYRHLEQVLCETGFLNSANPRHLMRRLRRLFNRAVPDQNEVNILRGILTSVQRSIRAGGEDV